MKYLLTLLAALLPTVLPAQPETDLEKLLPQLDEMLAHRETYIGHREHRIESVKTILGKSTFTPEQQYVLNQQLIEEYTPYQADSAIAYLYKNIALARHMGDHRKIDENRIALGYLYSSTGIYLEATNILGSVDTTRLDPQRLTDYYIARHKLNNELHLYSHDAGQEATSLRLTNLYIGLIIDCTEPGTPTHLNYRLEQSLRRNDYAEAERYACELVDLVLPLTRDYAIAAYMRAVVAELQGDAATRDAWYARAAMTDVQLAIRDNAALNSLANSIVHDDIQRAMRYMRVVMEDARFFNSRLRPWQDVRGIAMIEKAYTHYKQRTDATLIRFMLALTLLALVAGAGTLFALRQNRKLKATRGQLEAACARQNRSNDELKRFNDRLLELNNQISEANTVKEEYIGIFLMMCSEYIDKIGATRRHVRRLLRDGKTEELRREYTAGSADEGEVKAFYTMFDTTFLRLYPTFIEEFNQLLDEDARSEPKKGELLSTEQRIFALVRLGINDSSKIAALLRYSVSTIYNYRSKIKCRSTISRNEFEQRIRTIGSLGTAPNASIDKAADAA